MMLTVIIFTLILLLITASITVDFFKFHYNRNSDSAEKRQQPGSCMVDFTVSQQRNEKAFSRPLLIGPHSYFHFYIKEEDQAEGTQRNTGATGVGKTHKDGGAQQGTCSQNGGTSYSGMDDIEEDVEAAGGHPSLKEIMDESKTDRECASLSPFNIPNYVNMEPNSTGADDTEDESSIVLERQSYPRDVCCDIH